MLFVGLVLFACACGAEESPLPVMGTAWCPDFRRAARALTEAQVAAFAEEQAATLYCWSMDTPKDGALVREITIANTGNAGAIGIVAITAEKDIEL